MKSFKLNLNLKANLFSAGILLILAFTGYKMIPSLFSNVVKHNININNEKYLIEGSISGIGGHVKITIQRSASLMGFFKKNCRAEYSTADLSPVYFVNIGSKIHIFSAEEFNILNCKNSLPIIFHSMEDTIGFTNLKIVHPYCSGW